VARNEAFDCTVYGIAALEALIRLRRVNLSKVAPPVPIQRAGEPAQGQTKTKERRIVNRQFGTR
jgi:phage terminase large subunit GpA-like protein